MDIKALKTSKPRTQNPEPKTPHQKPQTVFSVSLGCPKNLVDTEIMLGGLTNAGWEVTGTPAAADLLLVNTCGFIEPACKEAVDTILDLARVKADRPEVRLVVTGCLVQRYGPELIQDLPEVDLFIGVNDFPALAELLARPQAFGAAPLVHQAPPYAYVGVEARYPATPYHLAYLKIAEGCGHGCTFCLIPQIRGPLRSRPLNTLVQEAENLAAAGVKELICVGQDTTAYGRDVPGHPGIAALLREVAAIDGFRWIRLLYGHPARITPELLATMAANPRILPYLDIPIQHGHNEVLRRMGRGYGRQDILDTVRRIRTTLPGATLRTTVMVGFPGETEAHFQALCDLITEVGFHHLGVFLYSPEAGTPAAAWDPKAPRREARRRARLIKTLQAKIVKARLKSLVGTVAEVLVEGVSPESDYLLTGRMTSQAPDIDGQVYITAGTGQVGEIQPVRLTRALPYDLLGEIVEAGEKA
ncbi:MAG: 30S ribosomal protein S12 methylthiotransferase RimO [Desulfobacterales bacterium]|nr:30S ribosomal protein S12 methylthiotransferase RimO [Desulfobacterales bacterium]